MKRFLFALLGIACSFAVSMTSSFAVDVYEVESDVQSFDLSSSLYSISPLATGDSAWTSANVTSLLKNVLDIREQVATVTNGTLKWYVYSIYNYLHDMSSDVENILKSSQNINNALGFTGHARTFYDVLGVPGGQSLWTGLKQIDSDILSLSTSFSASFGFPSGSSFYQSGKAPTQGWWDGSGYALYVGGGSSRTLTNATWYQVMNYILASLVTPNPSGSLPLLGANGKVYSKTNESTLIALVNDGIQGLATVMRGQSGSEISGSILSSSEVGEDGQLKATAFKANNLLSMMSPLLDVQNDLARITHVVADPVDQALKNANEDNIKEVTDKLTGDKGLKPSDIGDMSSVGSQIGDMIAPDISVGDAFSQASSDEAWGFFSQSVADELEPQNAARARSRSVDDDFISFIGMNEAERDRLLGKGSTEP